MELFKLLLSEHPASCLFCEEKSHCDECMVTLRKTGVTTGCRSCSDDGQCELQTLVDRFDLAEGGYPVRYRMLPVEKKDPFFDRDYNLCILCERCVRVCEENHFSSVVTLTSRGTDTVVGTPFGQHLLQAGCSFCGACVEVCPTGALSEKIRKWSGVPEREVSTTCPLCSAGCQMRLLVKNGMVIGSLPDHASGTDMLCVKGRFGITEMVNHPTRLQHPLTVDQEGSSACHDGRKRSRSRLKKSQPVTRRSMVWSFPRIAATKPCISPGNLSARLSVRNPSHLSSAAVYGHGLQTIQRLYGLSKPLSSSVRSGCHSMPGV